MIRRTPRSPALRPLGALPISLLASPLVLLFVLAAGSAWAQSTVVSFGVEGGQPTTETLGGLAVEPDHAVNIDDLALLWVDLPPAEDIDAFHFLPPSSVLFSTTTAVSLGGVIYGPGDVVEFDGASYSLFFDGSDITAAAVNVDAFSILPSGNLLISTSLSGTIHGFSFVNGDVVEVDPVAETASLFSGLSEAALFTGANQDVDALHYDADAGTLLMSVRTSGIGTITGLAYGDDASDVFEVELAGAISATVFLDGDALYDGETRQLDAVFLPEPGLGLSLACGALLAAAAGRGRRGGADA